ncbi:hypothetical protein BDP55DRAFT_94969 [Colletotrichum godetiae]|uniref:Uncharacterized protein n=1 Tax=Colletotrichum godetiae TaxID=1209918 RepID=A0AAJ0A7R3_9PEZI|nr:uncharacterized protein BDP55DRAFT_94969 [Colletotrichum godetiae]KAK1656572.1 hypothetical protein BDP55DRAFT_94969 [Colletotrichum godetiae]
MRRARGNKTGKKGWLIDGKVGARYLAIGYPISENNAWLGEGGETIMTSIKLGWLCAAVGADWAGDFRFSWNGSGLLVQWLMCFSGLGDWTARPGGTDASRPSQGGRIELLFW